MDPYAKRQLAGHSVEQGRKYVGAYVEFTHFVVSTDHLVSEGPSRQGNRRRTGKTKFAAMAKLLATDNVSKIVNDAMQLFGGHECLQDYPIERFWRDLRVHSNLEGTNQVMRMIVAREMLRQ